MEYHSSEMPKYSPETIISFILDIESIKSVLPKIFNPQTSCQEIENIYNNIHQVLAVICQLKIRWQ